MRRVQIRKVARLGTGHTPSRSVDAYWDPAECTIPWLTLADVWQLRDGTVSVVDETKEKISPLGLANSAAVRHPAGTVAFSRTASVGFSCILGTEMATSQDFVTWTCGPRLEPRYLLWALRGERESILRRTQGSTHKTIYMPDIEQLTIPLPSLDQQKRVAKQLDAATARIDQVIAKKVELGRRIAERLDAEMEAVFGAPSGVKLKRLVAGPLAYGVLVPKHDPDGVPMLRIKDFASGHPDPSNVVRIPVEQSLEFKRTILREGDLVVSVVGTLGRAAQVGPEFAGANLNRPLARVQLRPDVPAELILAWFSSSPFRRLAEKATSSDSAQPTLNLGDLKSFDVGIPPDPSGWPGLTDQVQARRALSAAIAGALEEQIALLREHRHAIVSSAVAESEQAA